MSGPRGDISGLVQAPQNFAQIPQTPQTPQTSANNQQTPQIPQTPAISQPQGAFPEAVQTLNLTPQEQYLYQHHLDNVMGPGGFVQPGGDYSSVLQANVQGPDGRTYNIPTVWFGQQLPVPIAQVMAAQAGWDRWPAYADPGEAERRYNDMHQFMTRDLALIGRP